MLKIGNLFSKKNKKKKKVKKLSIKARLLSFIWSLFWKVSLVTIATMLILGIYFDSKIERKFASGTWELPAQVYGRALKLEVGGALSSTLLIEELKLLNYRPVRDVQAPGQFSVNNNSVTFYRRAFDFADRPEGAIAVKVNFKNKKIHSLYVQGRWSNSTRLDALLLTRLYSDDIEDRLFIPFEKIPDLFINTLLLMEDRNYYHHQGISPFAIVRAFITNFKAGRTVQGGSTLTQQLAKNLFLTQKRSLWRKFQEAYIALLMDHKYSKDQLLEAYLNEVYLAQNGKTGIYGIALASHFYFSRPVNELRIEQIALLVAIIKGPSYYDPRRHPERALARRDLVLRLMVENNLIGTQDYRYSVSDALNVSARKALNKSSNPAFISRLYRELAQRVPGIIEQQNGLHIYTSISPLAQKHAEFAVQNGIQRVLTQGQEDLQGAMLVSDRQSAEIRAIVSGKDVKFSGFNRALDAKRPIGSLVKSAVYLTALENGYSLKSRIKDRPIILKNATGQRWAPKNYDRKYRGEVSLEYALVHSLNVPTVNLGMQVGLKRVINTLHKMGVKEKIKAYPSLVLGSLSLSPVQVSQMYQPITMQGRYQRLAMIRSISSADGELLYQRNDPIERHFSASAVRALNSSLHEVTQSGTARSLRWRNPQGYFYGKTGTTNNLKDSWFVGFDANELVTTWVGKDSNKSTKLTGSSGALVLFSYYMKQKNKGK
ncbi:penicillin-binding protein 1B [Psychromonas sp. CNPT3]|uniref:penicillin-binding protein 1B n=1 Tax=Psychromonas sp. CNPT3 TaxID=314282 RepID=UPI00006E78B7|nr:penicillin-binding protein 1B [Psychromonas sp. CNPT3]AGH82096.1 penicillin-binding protein 1B [Psychromonas sp. CNPT3]